MVSGLPTGLPHAPGPLRLSPFRALSLAPHFVGDPASARVFARPYRGVPQRLESWRRRGRARLDDLPSVYLHEYSDSGLSVRGFVGCLDLDPLLSQPATRRVLPHEGVHPKQVADLAARMDAMGVNPAPILLVHRGPATLRELSRAIRAAPPAHEYVDHADQQHRVWAIRDPEHLSTLAQGLAGARLLIADGHHRFAACLALAERSSNPARRQALAMVVDHQETPLFLGAIHRLLHGTKLADLLDAAARAGAVVHTIDAAQAVAALAPDTMVVTDGGQWATVAVPVAEGQSLVQLLESSILTQLRRPPSRVGYAHAVSEALEQARPGRVCATLLPAVDLDVVLATAARGELLPEKATSFQPKPSLGSFIRLLDE